MKFDIGSLINGLKNIVTRSDVKLLIKENETLKLYVQHLENVVEEKDNLLLAKDEAVKPIVSDGFRKGSTLAAKAMVDLREHYKTIKNQ